MRIRFLLGLSLFVMVVLSAAHAQIARTQAMANVPFSFTAGDKALTAGSYRFLASPASPWLEVRDADRKVMATLHIITRLGQRGEAGDDGKLIFDRVGEERYLSEVWVHGADGYLVRATDKEHSHESISVPTE